MKNRFSSLCSKYSLKIFNKLHCYIALLFKGKQIKPKFNTVFLIPPTDGGSLGDEAMIVASINYLGESNDVYIITSDGQLREKLDSYNIKCKFVFIPKLYNGFSAFYLFSRKLKDLRPESVYLIGADVMDGFYSKTRSLTRLALLDISSSYVKDVRLLGFSLNDTPDPSIIKYMKKMDDKVTFLSRDPVSSKRLSQHGIKNRLVADLAFGLKPNQNFFINGLTSNEWIHKYHSIGGFICINLNAIHLNNYGDKYFKSVCESVKTVIRLTNKHILFVSHDSRNFKGVTDLSFAERVADNLNLVNGRDFTLADESLNAENLKHLASQSEFLVTGRMHFAIGGLGSGIPSLMFGYQGKQEGLAKHFNINNDVLIIDPASDTKNMVDSIDRFVKSINELKLLIKQRQENIKALSLSNFD